MLKARRIATCLVLVAVLATLVAPSVAYAFVTRTGGSVTVSDPVSDDLYIFGTTILVSGNVTGDVIAFGTSITISGDVSGDVISAGQNVRVQGTVGGSVRAAGQDVEVAGPVAEDVVLAAATARVTSESSVGRDLVITGATVSVDGDVDRNVLAAAETLTIASAIGGNVTADAVNVTLESGGSIGGDLTYYSDKEAQVDGTVSGETDRRPQRLEGARPDPSPAMRFFLAVLAWFRSFIGIALFGILTVLALRRGAVRAADEVIERPLPSAGLGLAVLVLVFPVAGVVFLLGIFVGGWWIAIALLAAVWLLAMMGLVIGALAAARWLLARMGQRVVHPIIAALIGLLAIWLIGAIPFVGWLVVFAAMLFGTGALLLAAYAPSRVVAPTDWRESLPAETPPPPTM